MTSENFAQGIKDAVHICMNTQKDDRVLIISDLKTRVIGDPLERESQLAGAATKLVLLEDFGQRPMIDAPDNLIKTAIEFKPTVTYCAAESQAGEIKMRMGFSRKSRQGFDEKIPGIQIAFGDPIGYETGSDWSSYVHVDVVPTSCTIKIDDKILMEDGLFVL